MAPEAASPLRISVQRPSSTIDIDPETLAFPRWIVFEAGMTGHNQEKPDFGAGKP